MPEKLGRFSLLKVDVNQLGTVGGTPDWQEIPQRRDFSQEESTSLTSVTHAGTSGQEKKIPTSNDWTASIDLVYWPGDPIVKFLLDSLRAQKDSNPKQTFLQVDETQNGGTKEEASCWIENISKERPAGDAMTCSISFSGNSEWVASS